MLINKSEKLEKRNNFIFLLLGCCISVALLLIYREGFTWFSATNWSDISIVKWISISFILIVALLLQYYFLMLLRHSFLKYLVLWFIPIAWLFNNGIVAMHRFLDWTTDIVSPAGWIPLGDLVGWLLSAIFLPFLITSGAVVAIVDSSSLMITQACYYARIAIDVADISIWQIGSYILNFISIFWDIISNSLVQEIASETMKDRSFFEFNLSNAFRIPYWVQSIGYSFTCLLT